MCGAVPQCCIRVLFVPLMYLYTSTAQITSTISGPPSFTDSYSPPTYYDEWSSEQHHQHHQTSHYGALTRRKRMEPADQNSQTVLPDEQRLLYYLLRHYERAVRPVRNASTPIVVKLGLTLTNIFDMDEKNQVLTINVWLDQEWNDELLRWDPADFGGIDSLRVPCDLIWLPDIVLYNNADDYTTGYMRSRAMVYHDGTVFWPPPTQLRSTCKIDVTYFPFDSQRCYLKFGSWTYHGFQVDVTNRSSNVDLTNYVVSGEFDLVNVHQKRRVVKYTCCPEPYPDVTFFIHIRRKTLYYMYNVVFPCMMMSALTLLVFCLPPDSGEKIALGITVLLAFSVFVLAIAEKMPETSDSMPLIGIYLTVVMGMTSVSVVMTVMVLNFHHRGPFHKEIPFWIRWLILDKMRRFFCMKLPYTNMRAQPRQNNSLLRRLSLKLTIDNLQEELMQDMGLEQRRNHTRSSVRSRGVNSQNHQMGNCVASHDQIESIPLHHQLPAYYKSVSPHAQISHVAAAATAAATATAPPDGGDPSSAGAAARTQLHEEVLKTLQVLISRQELDDECEEIANEWRQVAQVIDRMLFWVFLLATVLITLLLLIIIPLVRHAQETDELDEKLFGLNRIDK